MRGFRGLAAAGAILFSSVCSGVGAQAAPALWRVSDADSDIYLFGTLHALSGAGWRTPAFDRAFAAARTVWFEADVAAGDPDTVRLLIQRYGSDPDVPLSHQLPPADAAVLARATDLARVEHLRPWAAALMLSARPTFGGRPATVEQGADLVLARAARDAGKDVRAFETLEDQARMYAGLPQGSQVRYLSSVLHERAKGPALRLPFRPAAFEAAWRAGRLTAADATALRTANPGLYDALLRRRTAAWADRISVNMDEGFGVAMVSVGALHMLGPDGLPALLAARGYRVERVQ